MRIALDQPHHKLGLPPRQGFWTKHEGKALLGCIRCGLVTDVTNMPTKADGLIEEPVTCAPEQQGVKGCGLRVEIQLDGYAAVQEGRLPYAE